MKILHVIPYFAPAWSFGGTPRAVYEIARSQVKNSHEVTILTTTAFEKNKLLPKGNFMFEGIKVIRVSNLSNYLMWKFHFTIPLIFQKINFKEFDIIHLHEVRTLLNVYTLLNVSGTQKVILSSWGTLPYNDQQILYKKIFDIFFKKIFDKKVDVFLGQNDHEIKIINQFFPFTKTRLIPLAINTNFFDKQPTRRYSRKLFNLSNDSFVWVFLGRFSAAKGISLLLNSFALFAKRYKGNTKLLFIGRDDGYLNEMKQIIKENHLEGKIFIQKPLYERERLKAYKAADGFIYTPIVYEETSTACLEALACGIPVLTTDKAEIPYLNEEDGVFISKSRESEVVKFMGKIVSSSIKVNKNKINSIFSWDNVVQKIQTAYE